MGCSNKTENIAFNQQIRDILILPILTCDSFCILVCLSPPLCFFSPALADYLYQLAIYNPFVKQFRTTVSYVCTSIILEYI